MVPATHHYIPLLMVILCLNCGSTFGSLFVVVPHEFHAGWPLKIAVTTHKTVPSPVQVSIALVVAKDMNNALGKIEDSLNPGETKTLSMQVPDTISTTSGEFLITVDATGGLVYTENSIITYNRNSSLVLVETDKAIYKPGQQVRIRVAHIDKRLRPVISPMTIIVENAKGSKLEEYKDVTSDTGVVEEVFQLSSNPSLGTWKILVTYDDGALHTATFTVEEFVLPRFSVDVKAYPSFLVLEDQDRGSTISVEAMYTYGKGVQGTCMLMLTSTVGGRITARKELNELGKAEFTDIDWNRLLGQSMGLQYISITAEVTDETGRKEAGITTLNVFDHIIRIEILKRSDTVLRDGLPSNIYMQVSDHSGNPIQPDELEISTSLGAIQNVNAQVPVAEGQTDVTFTFTPKKRDEVRGRDLIGTLEVKLKSNRNVKASASLFLYNSLLGNAVTVSKKNQDQILRVGEAAEFIVAKNSADVPLTLGYVVISQGNVVETGVPQDDTITITPTQEVCPKGELVIYMMAGNEKSEVVVDAINLYPSKCFAKEVEVSFDSAETRAGADANIFINVNRLDGSNALPGVHDVYYLAVDKSINLLQGSSYLKEDEVNLGLEYLDSKSYGIERGQKPYTAADILTDAGFIVFTTAQMEETVEPEIVYEPPPVFGGIMFKNADLQDIGGRQKMAQAESDDEDGQLALGSNADNTAPKVRKDFPDTWLWAHAQTGENGKLSKTVTLPDTITSWVVSAFAINKEGLAVCPNPFELTAFQLFFLSMNLPYSIKRGEVFVLRVTVFNYRTQAVTAIVRLERTNQFTVLDSGDSGEWVEKGVELPAGRASSVEFKINATTVGLMDLHVEAEDSKDGMMDEVDRKLLVKPEGEERSRAITKAMILSSVTSLDHTFTIDWPYDKIVPDSRRVEVKITGDVFGQSLSNLQRLVRQPFGCGEQNMISTVPNIFGLTYIRSTNQVGMEKLEEKLLKNMKLGYQREVDNYRHSDGSYSAWGERSSNNFHSTSEPAYGSTWLTAFVIRSFSQASKYILVDDNVLETAIRFLQKRQRQAEGDFLERGQVIHKEMQSGTGSEEALTVYVLISMLETTRAIGGDLVNLDENIGRAITYIMRNMQPDSLRSQGKPFLAAMSAYALSLVPERDSEVNKLLEDLLQVVNDVRPPWVVIAGKEAADGRYSQPTSQASNEVETASYYLLTLTRLGRIGEGVALMKWLQSKQNSFGGYSSTQDTVMALQALSEFGAAFSQAEAKGQVTVTDLVSGQSYDTDVSGSRAILLQSVELSPDTDEVQVTLTGPVNSVAIVKVVYTYYTLAGDDDMAPVNPPVEVVMKTSKKSETVHKVEACVKSSTSLKYNGMFVTSLTLPSGERALDDPDTILAQNPHASKVETEDEAIHFYLNEPPGEGYCLQAEIERQLEFDVQKPGSAKIYAYYEPEMVKEVALSLEGSNCVNDSCDRDSAITLNMASVLLTLIICVLISLLTCV